MRIITDNEPTAALRRVPLWIVDDTADAAPWAGSVTGVKPLLSINGGTESALAADVVRVAGGGHYAQLAQADVNLTPGDYGTVRVPAATGRREAIAAFVVGPAGTYDPIATDTSVATAVQTQLSDEFAAIPAAVNAALADDFDALPTAGEIATAVAAPSAATIATAVESQLANEFAAIPSAVDAAVADNFAAIPGAVVTALVAASDGRAFGVTTVPPGGTTVPLAVRNAGGAVIGSRNAFYNSAGQLVGLTAVA